MSPTLRPFLILALPLALTACGGAEKKAKDQRTAAGEILPGSISDAMLPYDTVRSQPPMAPEEVRKSSPKSGTVAEPDAGASDAADAAQDSSPALAETPAVPAPD
ncbi:MAG: hypothetical protein ABIQ81_08640 [Novosphingobium sp.]